MARRHRGRASDLKRRTGTRPERRTFVILCEGTVTEPDYLEALKRLPEVREVASVEIRGSAGVPLKLVEAAIEVKREKTRSTRSGAYSTLRHHRHIPTSTRRALGRETTRSRQRCRTPALRSGSFCTSKHAAHGSRPMKQSSYVANRTSPQAKKLLTVSICSIGRQRPCVPVN